jgi:hypothetical protein
LFSVSSLSFLFQQVNTKPRSAPVSPSIIASPQRSPSSLIISSPTPTPSSPSLTSPTKTPRISFQFVIFYFLKFLYKYIYIFDSTQAPVFLSSSLRSPSSKDLHTPRHSESIRTTREMLTTQSVAWITTFAETGGIESILQGLSTLSIKKRYLLPSSNSLPCIPCLFIVVQ